MLRLVFLFSFVSSETFSVIPLQSNKLSLNGTSSITWVSTGSGSDALLMNQEPVGKENSIKLFLCRAELDNRYIPGSLWIYNGEISCRIAEQGAEYKRVSFQMLQSPLGTTSWVPVTDGLPENAIVGGQHSNGMVAYICRGYERTALLVGSYFPENGTCSVARAYREYMITDDIEVLVANGYSRTL